MDLRQVAYALAVVDHGGFTRAAKAVHVAQPSLSQAVRRLEDELGAPLFLRLGRSVRLTEAGEAFVGPARRLLREAEQVRAAVGGHAGLLTGTVHVVALPTLVTEPLAGCVGTLRHRHPAIRVRVHDPGTPANLLAMLLDGRAEVGLTEEATVPHGLVGRSLAAQELVAVLPPGTRPAEGDGLRLPELARQPLILGPRGSSVRQVLERSLGAIGLEPQVAVETDQREAVVPLVVAGAGATVLPRSLAEEAAALGAVLTPFAPRLTRPVAVVHRDHDLSPAAQALLDLLPPQR